jgi:hypothetical protein
MDMIRKRPAPPHKPCGTTPETNVATPQEHPARPIDLLFPLDTSTHQVVRNPSDDDQHILEAARTPLFRRITPRPRRLKAPASVGAPDWSLSTGAAVVLLGFAIAVGTFITLTQRDAMQSRLRRIVSQNEQRAASRHDRPTITERTQELARALRDQIEALRSRDAADAAIVAGAAANQSANAHSSKLASSTPGLPSAPPPAAVPAKKPPANLAANLPAKQPASQSTKPPTKQPISEPSAKQLAAKPLAPPLPQPAPHARQVTSAAPARAHNTAAAQPESRVNTKPANTACGTRTPCVQTATQSSRKTTKTSTASAHRKPAATAAESRKLAAKTPAKPAPPAVPYTIQAYSPPDSPAPLPVDDDREIFRQH